MNARLSMQKPDDFDYLRWAKRPGSHIAMRAVVECAAKGDDRFVAILAQLKADSVCDENGRLLKRWDAGAHGWVKL